MQNLKIIIILLFFVSCSHTDKKLNANVAANRNAGALLALVNNDTTSFNSRVDYVDKAFTLLTLGENDSLNRKLLFKVADEYYDLQKFDQYKKTSQFTLQRSLKVNDTASIGRSFYFLAEYFYNRSQQDSALFYFIKAERFYQNSTSSFNLATLKIGKASVLWQNGDFFSAESTVFDALLILRTYPDDRKLYESYSLLALISSDLNNYKKAIEYNERAINVIGRSISNTSEHLKAVSLNNLGSIYQKMGRNDDAIQKFKLALKDDKIDQDNPNLYAILLNNIAYSKYMINRQDIDVERFYNEALEIQYTINNIPQIIFSKVRFAEYYQANGNFVKALELSKDALSIASKNGSSVDKLAPLKQLSIIDPPNSSKYAAQYITIVDSLQQAERQVKDKFARIQFETDEISLQKDKLEEQNRNLLLFFVGTVMIGLLLFVIRTQRAKNRELLHKQAQQKANEDIYNLLLAQQNKIEEGRIQEKKRIAQELHDGVLGRLFGARLNLDSLNKMDGEFAEEKRNNYLSELKNIEQDIREISHDLNREKFALINNFLAILTVLLDEQANSFSPKLVVNIDDDIKWENVQNSLKINLYRIAQESLQNINKYAKANTIYFSLQEHLGNIVLTVKDDGVGFATDKKNKGIGLQNMISRVNECDGVFDVSSQKGSGTTIKIEIPIENKSITA